MDPDAYVSISCRVDIAEAIQFLEANLGYDRLVKLADLIQDVIMDSGYGDVKIIISDSTVQTLKIEKSYK